MTTTTTARTPISEEQIETLYRKYTPMAKSMAYKFSRTFHLPYADVEAEAMGILGVTVCRWEQWYDPSKSSVTSAVYRSLYWDLMTAYTRKNDKARTFTSLGENEDQPMVLPAKENRIERLLRELGEDAKIIVNTILAAPAEIAEDLSPSTKSRARKALQSYLSQQGWTAGRIASAWKEVSEGLLA